MAKKRKIGTYLDPDLDDQAGKLAKKIGSERKKNIVYSAALRAFISLPADQQANWLKDELVRDVAPGLSEMQTGQMQCPRPRARRKRG